MISVDVIKITADQKALKSLMSNAFVVAAEEVGKGILQDYKSTIETWDDKPVFKQVTRSNNDKTERRTWTTNDIYRYVHDGTDIRYVVLSQDFEPKTIPGFLGSFSGKGGVVRFDYNRPQPGIIARNFTDSIIVKRQGKMLPILTRHLGKAVRVSGFAYP